MVAIALMVLSTNGLQIKHTYLSPKKYKYFPITSKCPVRVEKFLCHVYKAPYSKGLREDPLTVTHDGTIHCFNLKIYVTT